MLVNWTEKKTFWFPCRINSFRNQNTYEHNLNLIISNSHLFSSNMRIGTYLDQTLAIMKSKRIVKRFIGTCVGEGMCYSTPLLKGPDVTNQQLTWCTIFIWYLLHIFNTSKIPLLNQDVISLTLVVTRMKSNKVTFIFAKVWICDYKIKRTCKLKQPIMITISFTKIQSAMNTFKPSAKWPIWPLQSP